MLELRRVLIVDDDQVIRTMVGLVLSDEGYGVLEAPDEGTALRLLDVERPDLILLDMSMPGMDGREFTCRYRAATGPHVPIIVFTAARVHSSEIAGLQADGFLSKPFDLEELLALVARHLAPEPRLHDGAPPA